jgi:hypothetical protein
VPYLVDAPMVFARLAGLLDDLATMTPPRRRDAVDVRRDRLTAP